VSTPLRPLDWRGASTALFLAALWGGNPVAVKIGLADAPPLRLAFFRFLVGGLVVLAYAWWRRQPGLFHVRPGE
jgi:drug/metabolite transporter (DMT)-like permease